MTEKKEDTDTTEKRDQAAENLKRIEKLIAPYLPQERPIAKSTAGKWRETTSRIPPIPPVSSE